MTFKNIFLTLLFVSFVSSVAAQDAKWEIDKSHSSITFKVSHFKIATVKGNFDDFSGAIQSKGEDFNGASTDITIKTASINTNQKDRDKHLRSADFFNAEAHPEITFKNASFTKVSDKDYTVKGDLTINGITKPFEFAGTFKGSFVHPRFKKTIGVFEFSGTLPRLDYKIGSKFPTAALGGDVEVAISLETTKA
ncbi:YceI family protein [Pontimicrobium sp. MEBiC06410]